VIASGNKRVCDSPSHFDLLTGQAIELHLATTIAGDQSSVSSAWVRHTIALPLSGIYAVINGRCSVNGAGIK